MLKINNKDSNAARALDEYVVFDDTIEMAKKMTNKEDTLIVITADHSHVFTMGGYAIRGNDVLGTVVSRYNNVSLEYANENGEKVKGITFTVLNYANGPGGLKKIRYRNLTDDETSKHLICLGNKKMRDFL